MTDDAVGRGQLNPDPDLHLLIHSLIVRSSTC